MEKTIKIDGKDVSFKSTGAVPKRYKAQFGRDFFKDLIKMGNGAKLDANSIDFDVLYDIAWTLAKTADPSIKDPITWLDGFDSFPIVEILPEIQELMTSSIATVKK